MRAQNIILGKLFITFKNTLNRSFFEHLKQNLEKYCQTIHRLSRIVLNLFLIYLGTLYCIFCNNINHSLFSN